MRKRKRGRRKQRGNSKKEEDDNADIFYIEKWDRTCNEWGPRPFCLGKFLYCRDPSGSLGIAIAVYPAHRGPDFDILRDPEAVAITEEAISGNNRRVVVKIAQITEDDFEEILTAVEAFQDERNQHGLLAVHQKRMGLLEKIERIGEQAEHISRSPVAVAT